MISDRSTILIDEKVAERTMAAGNATNTESMSVDEKVEERNMATGNATDTESMSVLQYTNKLGAIY
jgi:hypothetical protein